MGVDILLVEDNADDAELAIRAIMQHDGATNIQVVEDGAEALEYVFATHRYHDRPVDTLAKVVFLDVKLPFVDGFEVLKSIKSDPRTQRTPVVMMTSSDALVDRARAYDLGANSYIVKPVEFQKLTTVVHSCASYWLRLNRQPPI